MAKKLLILSSILLTACLSHKSQYEESEPSSSDPSDSDNDTDTDDSEPSASVIY